MHLQATGDVQLDPPGELERMRGGFFCDEPVRISVMGSVHLQMKSESQHLEPIFFVPDWASQMHTCSVVSSM